MRTMELMDGRGLCWREYGDPEGYPVVFTHGVFNSRLFEPMWEKTQEVTAAAGARVIAVDRPGYGQSSFCAQRSYTQWADDVRQLCDHLGLDRIAVFGFSSGGPSALACACHLAPRVTACALSSSDAPYMEIDRATGSELLLQMHGANSSLTHEQAAKNARAAHAALAISYTHMKNKKRMATAIADLREAVSQGIDKGSAQDGTLESNVWGFALKDVKVPVLLAHGLKDEEVPPSAAQFMADRLPSCTLRMIPGESHSLLRRHWDSLLRDLLALAQRRGTKSKL